MAPPEPSGLVAVRVSAAATSTPDGRDGRGGGAAGSAAGKNAEDGRGGLAGGAFGADVDTVERDGVVEHLELVVKGGERLDLAARVTGARDLGLQLLDDETCAPLAVFAAAQDVAEDVVAHVENLFAVRLHHALEGLDVAALVHAAALKAIALHLACSWPSMGATSRNGSRSVKNLGFLPPTATMSKYCRQLAYSLSCPSRRKLITDAV